LFERRIVEDGVRGHVEHERRLAALGPGAEDEQLARPGAVHHVVDLGIARGHAHDPPARVTSRRWISESARAMISSPVTTPNPRRPSLVTAAESAAWTAPAIAASDSSAPVVIAARADSSVVEEPAPGGAGLHQLRVVRDVRRGRAPRRRGSRGSPSRRRPRARRGPPSWTPR
jgi:hypothetical protein